jgi:hypothetical protein
MKCEGAFAFTFGFSASTIPIRKLAVHLRIAGLKAWRVMAMADHLPSQDDLG